MKYIVLFLIRVYRLLISPLFPPSCRFYPSCSEYSYEAIAHHGLWKGLWYSIIRIGKCHPLHPGGYDPVKK